MLPGLMQRTPLMIADILKFGATAHPDRGIVSRLVDEPMWRYDYAGLARRAARLAYGLTALGVAPGDRVSSLAWNTHRHLELFYAVPGIGAVLHTANPRLSEDQLVYTIDHAGSQILFFERSFTALIEKLRLRLSAVTRFVMLADEPENPLADGIGCYETMLADSEESYAWRSFDENSAAFLCYTSGTTGDPKGVLYSHRSVVLHAMAAGLSGALGMSAFDVILPCQSLYHATAWGLPFAAMINGAKLVLPCDRFDGASLQQLIREEGVTFSGGVPTIWTMYLEYLRQSGEDSGSLQRLIIGGSAVPRSIAETFRQVYGVTVRQLWGMTETSPLGVVATPTPALVAQGADATDEVIWTRQGRLQFGIEVQIIDEHGQALPWDGASAGALMVRGPWVVERYYRAERDAVDCDGWFDTGDIATIDPQGFVRLTDRAKDVIKSGGEWISSIDLENAASDCPGVQIAAVIAIPHPKWEERPLLMVEMQQGARLSEAIVREYLATRVPKWWLPEQGDILFVDAIPLTSVGKIDKKRLRELRSVSSKLAQ